MTPQQRVEIAIKGRSLVHGHKPEMSHLRFDNIVQFHAPVSQKGERNDSHKHAEASNSASCL